MELVKMDQSLQFKSLQELETQISNRIDDFNNRRHSLKNWRNTLVVGQAISAALATVLIAINIEFTYVGFSVAAIVASALSSLTGLFLVRFMFHERLTSQVNTICELRELGSRVKMHKMKALDDEKNYAITITDIENYFEELQTALNIANNEWQKMIIKNKPKLVKKNDFNLEDTDPK